MRRTWKKAKPKEEKNFKINQHITAAEVFLINADGENVGRVKTAEALRMAEEQEMDLVEVNPKVDLPVVKIMNYGQFKYEVEKRAHKQRVQQKKVETKGIRLSVRISKHDFDFRVNQAVKFLTGKNKLKIELVLKGRERQHPEKAREVINEFITNIEQISKIALAREQDLTIQGGKFTMILVDKND